MAEKTAPEETIFEHSAETSLDRRERLLRRLDASVFAPFRIMWSDIRGRVGMILVLVYILMGTVGVVVIDPAKSHPTKAYVPPFTSLRFPLGTEGSGKGLFAMVVHSTPQILKMVLAGGVFAIMMGAVVGMVAGYKGGTVETLLMMAADVLLTLPGLPLVIVLLFIFNPKSPYIIGIVLAINNWSGLARTVRSQILTLRDESYVEASRVMGIPTQQIVLEDLVPPLMPYILVNFVNAARRIIFESVGLYFLGILPAAKPNWGVMMNHAYKSGGALYTWKSAHWLIVPMAAIVFFALGLILLAQSADQVFNPRLRARHASKLEAEEGAEQPEGGATSGRI